jgi:hypothetical protein
VATAKSAPAAAAPPPAAAIRALTHAIAGLGRQLGIGQGENANTVVHLLGASLADVQALHEYLKSQGG